MKTQQRLDDEAFLKYAKESWERGQANTVAAALWAVLNAERLIEIAERGRG